MSSVPTRRVRALTALCLLAVLGSGLSSTAALAQERPHSIRQPAVAPAQPAPPSRLTLGASVAQFTWPAIAGATGYRVRLSAYGTVRLERAWTATNVLIDGLDPEATYEFSFAAVNADGVGAYSTPVSFTTPFDRVERQFGSDRFATAARVSFRAHPVSGVGSVFVADGLNFPDTLSAAAAAGRIGAPVLLTRPTVIPTATRSELNGLAPARAVVVGGTGAVSDDVASALGAPVTRLAGVDRFETAAAVSTLWASTQTVYLANGMDFPDALAGAAAAGSKDSPVLLTRADALPEATASALARLKPARIVVLGGAAVVGDEVAAAAAAATGVTTTVQRLAGESRFDTAVAVSKATFPTAGVPVVYIANGMSFADALAAAAAGGERGGPVLLTPQSALPTAVIDEVTRLKPQRIVLLGGPSVVGYGVLARLLALAQ